MYSRLVGDIIISKDEKNINQWLAEEGWAFPTFYNSMTGEEITILDSKSKVARTNSKGIWKDYSDTLAPFDTSLFLPPKSERDIDSKFDMGKVNLPKIFRRQVQYEVSKAAGITDQIIIENLSGDSKEGCVLYYYRVL